MATYNSGTFTLTYSRGSVTINHKDFKHKEGSFKYESMPHDNGGNKPQNIQHKNVGSSETGYIEITTTFTVQMRDILNTIGTEPRELVKIQNPELRINCQARLEEKPESAGISGEITLKFLVDEYL